MKKLAGITFILMCASLGSCGDDTPHDPGASWVRVYVHWGAMGVAGKRIEVLELATESLTDSTGIATFQVPAGQYTVRAHGINTPGPPPLFVERSVGTTRGKTAIVDIVDCLPCVALEQGDWN